MEALGSSATILALVRRRGARPKEDHGGILLVLHKHPLFLAAPFIVITLFTEWHEGEMETL